jgi:hypothetical protein
MRAFVVVRGGARLAFCDDDDKRGCAALTVITVTTVIAQAKRDFKGRAFDA